MSFRNGLSARFFGVYFLFLSNLRIILTEKQNRQKVFSFY